MPLAPTIVLACRGRRRGEDPGDIAWRDGSSVPSDRCWVPRRGPDSIREFRRRLDWSQCLRRAARDRMRQSAASEALAGRGGHVVPGVGVRGNLSLAPPARPEGVRQRGATPKKMADVPDVRHVHGAVRPVREAVRAEAAIISRRWRRFCDPVRGRGLWRRIRRPTWGGKPWPSASATRLRPAPGFRPGRRGESAT